MYLSDIYDRLSIPAKIAAFLGVYFLSGFFTTVLFFPLGALFSSDLPAIIAAALAVTTLLQVGAAFVAARLLGRKVPFAALVLLGPFATTVSIATLVLFLELAHGHTAEIASLVAAAAAGLAASAIIIIAIGRAPDNEAAVNNALVTLFGITFVALVVRLLAPEVRLEGDIMVHHTVGPLIAGFTALGFFWRRNDIAAPLIWPVGAAISSTVLIFLLSRDTILLPALLAAVGGILGGVLWWAIGFIYTSRARIFGAKDWLWAFGRRELTGLGALEPLQRRVDYLGADLIYLGVLLLLIYRVVSNKGAYSYSQMIEFATALGYVAAILFLLGSLGLRVVRRQRIRPIAVIAAALTVVFVMMFVLILMVTLINLKWLNNDHGWILLLAGLIASIVIAVYAVRRTDFTPGRVRVGFLLVFGALLCDALFIGVLGSARFNFDIGLPVGDVGALVANIAMAITYLLHRRQPGAFLIWPVGGVVAGVVLRAFSTVEKDLADLSTSITVRTDFGEIILSAVIGAMAAAGVLLIKRVWIDKDPVSRLRAVRVRGALLIVHGITPILILLFIVLSFNAFIGHTRHDVQSAGQNLTLLLGQAIEIKSETQSTIDGIDQDTQKLISDVQAMGGDATGLAESLKAQSLVVIDESKAAATQVATQTIQEVKDEGTKVLDAVGDQLSKALTPPPIDLGLFKIDIPDLGIGSAIKGFMGSIFSGMLPDLDFSAILDNFVSSTLSRVEDEFAGPKARVEAMQQQVATFVSTHTDLIGQDGQSIKTRVDTLVASVQSRKETVIGLLKQTTVNVINVAYQFLVLIVMILFATLVWLLWKIVNGFVVMAERVRRGWRMIATGTDPSMPAIASTGA